MKKNIKITILVILGILLLIGGIFLLKEVQKKKRKHIFYKKQKSDYFNNVNANNFSPRIHYIHGMSVEAKVDGIFGKNIKVTDDNSDFSWNIYNDPKNKTIFSLGSIEPSDSLEKKLKWKYSDDNPHAESLVDMKSPTEFIPRKDLNQIPKNKKKLINYIPGTESY